MSEQPLTREQAIAKLDEANQALISVTEEYNRIKDTMTESRKVQHLETVVPLIAKIKEFKDKYGI